MRHFIAGFFSLSLLMPFAPANAAVIGTDAAIGAAERSARIERVQSALAREDVRRAMVRLGVDPGAAKQRVAGLTDRELASLEGRLDELPAGGDFLAVVGVVAVVLIILELVGVTNVFTKL